MAALAIDAQFAFVGVITFVASVTLNRGIFIVIGQMTFLARNSSVQTNQREARNIVFEFHTLAPAFFIMALITLLALFTLMHIVNFVAGITIGLEFCLIYMCFVTGGAIYLHVLAA